MTCGVTVVVLWLSITMGIVSAESKTCTYYDSVAVRDGPNRHAYGRATTISELRNVEVISGTHTPQDFCTHDCAECKVDTICSALTTALVTVDPNSLANNVTVLAFRMLQYLNGNCSFYQSKHDMYPYNCRDDFGNGCSVECPVCYDGILCTKLTSSFTLLNASEHTVPRSIVDIQNNVIASCRDVADVSTGSRFFVMSPFSYCLALFVYCFPLLLAP